MVAGFAVVGAYPNRLLAEIAKGRLEEAGILVVLADDTASAQTGPVAMPSWTSIRLLVPQGDLDRARRLLGTPAVRAPEGPPSER